MENDPVATARGSVTRHQNRQADKKGNHPKLFTSGDCRLSLQRSSPVSIYCLPISLEFKVDFSQRALSATVSVFGCSPASSFSAARSAFHLGACMPVLSPSIQACTKKYLLP